MNRPIFTYIVIMTCALIFLVIHSFLSYEVVEKQQPPTVVTTSYQYARSLGVAIFVVSFFALLGLVLLFIFLLSRVGKAEHIQSVNEHGEPTNIIINRIRPTSTYKGKAKIAEGEGDVQWLNIIIQRVMEEFLFKNSSKIRDFVIAKVDSELKLPGGPIQITDLNIGAKPLRFNEIHSQQTKDHLIVDLDLEYEDPNTIVGVKTSVNVNLPADNWLSLPFGATLSNFFLHARVRLSFTNDFRKLDITFVEHPDFDMIFANEIGDRTTIRNLPYITDIINRQLFVLIRDKLLEPNKITIDLPEIQIPPQPTPQTKPTSVRKTKQEIVEQSTDDDEFSISDNSDDEEPIIRRRPQKYRNTRKDKNL